MRHLRFSIRRFLRRCAEALLAVVPCTVLLSDGSEVVVALRDQGTQVVRLSGVQLDPGLGLSCRTDSRGNVVAVEIAGAILIPQRERR